MKILQSLSSLFCWKQNREGDRSSLCKIKECVYFGWFSFFVDFVRAEWWWVATLPLYFVDEWNY